MSFDNFRHATLEAAATGHLDTATAPTLTSQALLGGKREVVIVHAGREYRLRLTQNGKLILTA